MTAITATATADYLAKRAARKTATYRSEPVANEWKLDPATHVRVARNPLAVVAMDSAWERDNPDFDSILKGGRPSHAENLGIDVDAVIAAVAGGETMTSVGRRLGLHEKVVRRILDDAGERGRQARKARMNATDLPVEEIAAAYLAGTSMHNLGEKYHASAKTIRAALVAAGVPIRAAGGRRGRVTAPRCVPSSDRMQAAA